VKAVASFDLQFSTQFHYNRSVGGGSPHVGPECAGIWSNCFNDLLYLPDCPRICPCVRASNQATGHSVYMSVHPSVTFNYNDLRSSAYLTNKIRKFKCSASCYTASCPARRDSSAAQQKNIKLHRIQYKPIASCLFHDRVSTTQVRQSAISLRMQEKFEHQWEKGKKVVSSN